MKIIRYGGVTHRDGSKGYSHHHVYPDRLEIYSDQAAIALAYLLEYLQEFVLYGYCPSTLSARYSRYDCIAIDEREYSEKIFNESRLIIGYLQKIAYANDDETSNRLLAELTTLVPVLGEFLPDIETKDDGADDNKESHSDSSYSAWNDPPNQ